MECGTARDKKSDIGLLTRIRAGATLDHSQHNGRVGTRMLRLKGGLFLKIA